MNFAQAVKDQGSVAFARNAIHSQALIELQRNLTKAEESLLFSNTDCLALLQDIQKVFLIK